MSEWSGIGAALASIGDAVNELSSEQKLSGGSTSLRSLDEMLASRASVRA